MVSGRGGIGLCRVVYSGVAAYWRGCDKNQETHDSVLI